MNDNESEGIACGEKAYAALAEQLSGLQTRSDPAQLQHLQEWVNVSLPQFLSERRAAADYVAAAGSAAGGPAAEQAAQAAESLREMARLGMELRRELLSLLKPGAGAEPPPEASWPETAERVHQMQNADQKAQSHLAEIAR